MRYTYGTFLMKTRNDLKDLIREAKKEKVDDSIIKDLETEYQKYTNRMWNELVNHRSIPYTPDQDINELRERIDRLDMQVDKYRQMIHEEQNFFNYIAGFFDLYSKHKWTPNGIAETLSRHNLQDECRQRSSVERGTY